jgi:guanine nucleotide exchange factor
MSTTEQLDPNIDHDLDLYHLESKLNKTNIKCLRCKSFILSKEKGHYTILDKKLTIPSMKQTKKELNEAVVASGDGEDASKHILNEEINKFWLVHDMLTFENIGFTNSVDKKKYLICADCEIGPIGVQDTDNPSQLLLCIDRVQYI